MRARAPLTHRPKLVHYWENDEHGFAESACGGINADSDYLRPTKDPVDCLGCVHNVLAAEIKETRDAHTE